MQAKIAWLLLMSCNWKMKSFQSRLSIFHALKQICCVRTKIPTCDQHRKTTLKFSASVINHTQTTLFQIAPAINRLQTLTCNLPTLLMVNNTSFGKALIEVNVPFGIIEAVKEKDDSVWYLQNRSQNWDQLTLKLFYAHFTYDATTCGKRVSILSTSLRPVL